MRQLDTNNRQQPLELRILELRAGEAAKVGPLVEELFTALMKDRHGTTISRAQLSRWMKTRTESLLPGQGRD